MLFFNRIELTQSWRCCTFLYLNVKYIYFHSTWSQALEWWLCTTDGALTPYVSETCNIKGSHLCPLTPGCFSGVCWTCVSSAEECGEGRCCRDSPLPGWARPKTHPPQYSAGAHLWTSPWAWTEIRTIQNMIMAINSFGKLHISDIKMEEFKKTTAKSKSKLCCIYIAKETSPPHVWKNLN